MSVYVETGGFTRGSAARRACLTRFRLFIVMAMQMFSAAATADKEGLLAFLRHMAAQEVEDADHGDPDSK
ncbi:hypothetical protein D1345_11360 [Chromobacterium rhizoryzae]|uniref:Uncharacterized protein n=1 Tax=Chromobacterium rhizoryzae TaxID=1778675 RepID=A0AAD0W8V0_9NEIS|nr:hypothetical protein D1345_11360 [Chromobacterium rhizoryzae]